MTHTYTGEHKVAGERVQAAQATADKIAATVTQSRAQVAEQKERDAQIRRSDAERRDNKRKQS